MKKTTREFSVCPRCDGMGKWTKGSDESKVYSCPLCDETGFIVIKETIEEFDKKSGGIKEFIEKKFGWELVEAKSD